MPIPPRYCSEGLTESQRAERRQISKSHFAFNVGQQQPSDTIKLIGFIYGCLGGVEFNFLEDVTPSPSASGI